MNFEIARDLKIKYTVNDKRTIRVFPIKGHDSQNIFLDVLLLINDFGISFLTIELSKPYLTSKNKVFDKEELLNHLTSTIKRDLGENNTLKLTK